MKNDVTWKIGGSAGFGIMSSGIMLSKAYSRAGYFVSAQNEYPSLIRGGHNVITVRIAVNEFYSLTKHVDILVALNKETVELHKNELTDGSIVLFDPKDFEWKASDFTSKVILLPLSFSAIASSFGGDLIVKNTIALGATVALLGKDMTMLEGVIRDQFQKKGEAVIEENIKLAKAGYDGIKNGERVPDACVLEESKRKDPYVVMNVSESVGFGALSGGMTFAAIYPMTPINALITFFTDNAKDSGITYIQPEDEIAGINMAIGASLSGAPSMVATSGGGFALMVEGVSLAGILEVPLVIDLGMRPGPATGMPTSTEQGELQFVIHAGHGEFPRIVLAPGDATEAFRLTQQAFILAERYQTTVFILTDKYLNEGLWSVPESVFLEKLTRAGQNIVSIGPSFKRYDLTGENGVSPRSIPGTVGGEYIANSYEHDEVGYTTEESAKRKAMVDKRAKKMTAIVESAPLPSVYGDADSDVTFVSFGSTKGPILEAIKTLKEKNISSKLIHFSWVYPLPEEKVKDMLSREKRLISVEGNSTGQLASLLKEVSGVEIKEKLLKYDGRQVYPEEIVDFVTK